MCKTELIPTGRAKDITGERFGRLLVIGRTHNIGKDTAWLCKCDCGNYKSVRTSGLKTGDYVSCGCKQREHVTKLGLSNAGKNNPSYNHDLTDEQRTTDRFHRSSHEAKRLRIQTYTRDGFKCRVCGGNDNRIVAHHLESFAENVDVRFELDNMVTLCEGCHVSFHKEYGYGHNTKEQFEEFKNKIT